MPAAPVRKPLSSTQPSSGSGPAKSPSRRQARQPAIRSASCPRRPAASSASGCRPEKTRTAGHNPAERGSTTELVRQARRIDGAEAFFGLFSGSVGLRSARRSVRGHRYQSMIDAGPHAVHRQGGYAAHGNCGPGVRPGPPYR